MRIAIVGSGIAALTAAGHLRASGRHGITVFERERTFGGRANTLDGGEHCARLFLSDYDHLLDALAGVPSDEVDGGSVAASLRPLRRLCHTESLGWVEISHLYPLLSDELRWRDKVELVRERRRTPILAERASERRRRRLRLARGLSLGGWVRVVENVLTRPRTYGFEGPTEQCLVRPWVRHLEDRGVALHSSSPVERLEPHAEGTSVSVGGVDLDFDAVVVTAFLPDAAELLARSDVGPGLPERENIHCQCLTLELDPREEVLDASGPVLLAGMGISMVVQPASARCTGLCTNFDFPPPEVMLDRVRRLLDLRHPERSVAVRTNLAPSEGLFCSTYVDPRLAGAPHIYLAGSYVRNSYPVDSGEGAARSAFAAVERMAATYGSRLGPRPMAPPPGRARTLLEASR